MLINLILTILLLNPASNVYFSDKPIFNIPDIDRTAVPERVNLENIGVKTTADRFVAVDASSGEVLLDRDVNAPQAIASITKLMTALVILDLEPDWQDVVEMTKADETVGAYPHLYRGEEVLFLDLWKSALISSDNNAIMAMVRSLGFSVEEFSELMNKKADELGMQNSSFAYPTGLDEHNLSTPMDVARLVYYSMEKNEIKETVTQGKYSFPILNSKKNRNIYSTDILIDSFLNSSKYGYELIGGKTGFLYESGYCLAVEIEKDGNSVIIVVLNSDTIESRFQDVKVIGDWVFSNYEW